LAEIAPDNMRSIAGRALAEAEREALDAPLGERPVLTTRRAAVAAGSRP